MPSFEEMIGILLAQKPGVTREQIDEKIREKKEKIGAGYLNDEGAVFLVAADMGVTLQEVQTVETSTIKELQAGAKDVSINARVMCVSPVRNLTKKDGSPLMLRTMAVYDGTAPAVTVKLWDEKAQMPGVDGLKPGDPVRITRAYVRADRNGETTVNVGSGAAVERDPEESPIKGIDAVTKDVSIAEDGEFNIAVSGALDGPISPFRFTNQRGEPSDALRVFLKGSDGKSYRTVIWGRDDRGVPRMVKEGASVKMYGVRARQGQRGVEISGNDATVLQIDGTNDISAVPVRIISAARSSAGERLILGATKEGRVVSITDTGGVADSCVEGDAVELMPSSAHAGAIRLESDALARKIDDESLPGRDEVRTKIGEIEEGGNLCVEVAVVRKNGERTVQTRNGETRISDMVVGDDTGNRTVAGWRDQADLVESCEIGAVYYITGLIAKPGMEGRLDLTMTQFSAVTPRASTRKLG